ncbi:MAG: 50S ribosomal protein L4 [Chloroflexi bacterium]|nr:50S ribosomal protein L4 [Chloroflexota bacterium]
MQLPIYDTKGNAVGALEVSDLLFGVPMRTSVVHQALVRQLANARQGTSNTKTRAMVSGGGIKPRPQKHSGKSRQGSIRSPQWRHGGVVFGPHPRSYHQRMPKKMRRLAIRCLFSDKAQGDRITILQTLDLAAPKTSDMKDILQALNVSTSVLVVTPQKNDNVVLSARNLQRVKTLPAGDISVGDLVNHDRLVMTVDAVRIAESLWAKAPGKSGDAGSEGEA